MVDGSHSREGCKRSLPTAGRFHRASRPAAKRGSSLRSSGTRGRARLQRADTSLIVALPGTEYPREKDAEDERNSNHPSIGDEADPAR